MRKLSLSLAIAGLMSPLANTNAGEPNFYKYSPKESSIGGISYPADVPLYRGTSAKRLSLLEAIKGMYGVSEEFMTSTTFKAIRNALMKKSPDKYTEDIKEIAYKSDRMDSIVRSMVREAKRKHGDKKGRIVDWNKASQLAKQIFDAGWATRSEAQDLGNYIDYKSEAQPIVAPLNGYAAVPHSNYQGNGKINWPKRVLFSTMLPHIAGFYGQTVAVYRDNPNNKRTIDLGYWNHIHNDMWFKSEADAGEFVVPGYVAANNIMGYEMRALSGTTMKKGKTQSIIPRLVKIYNNIEYAFYKSTINGKQIVLLFSGKKPGQIGMASFHQCITKVSETNFQFCHSYQPAKGERATPPRATGGRVPLIGAVMLCDKGASCNLPSEVRNNFSRARSYTGGEIPLPSKLEKLIKPGKEATVGNKVVRFIRL